MANFKNKDDKKSESNAYEESTSKKDGTNFSGSNQKNESDKIEEFYDEDIESGSDYKSPGSFSTYTPTKDQSKENTSKNSGSKKGIGDDEYSGSFNESGASKNSAFGSDNWQKNQGTSYKGSSYNEE
ncbi:MAG: hypothetical protein ACXVNM_11240, partial [Bacteroidia bacterium]